MAYYRAVKKNENLTTEWTSGYIFKWKKQNGKSREGSIMYLEKKVEGMMGMMLLCMYVFFYENWNMSTIFKSCKEGRNTCVGKM